MRSQIKKIMQFYSKNIVSIIIAVPPANPTIHNICKNYHHHSLINGSDKPNIKIWIPKPIVVEIQTNEKLNLKLMSV